MSSPIANLRKTSLTSEKIIKNGLEFRSKGPKTMEADVYYVRRNSPPELMDKENLILNMTNRLANLENEMMGVRIELSRAIEVINRKDAEITMLKQQLYQQDNRTVHLPTTVADKRVKKKAYREYNDGHMETPGDYYDTSNIDWEEKYYDLSDRVAEMEGVRYHVPFESQSVPALHRNAKQHYYPTGHHHQSRNWKQQEYGGHANKVRGPDMDFEIASPGTPDSTTMGTVFEDSYKRDDYKKNIYDATAALAQKRRSLHKSPFDTDEEYEHMVILNKKRERGKMDNDDPDDVRSQKEGKRVESETQIDSEYEAFSHNSRAVRKSIDEQVAVRNSIKDPNGFQNTLNENMIHERQLNGKIKSNIPSDSEDDLFSSNTKEVRKSIDERAAIRKNSKDPHRFQNTLNENISHKGQSHRNMKSETPSDSEQDAYIQNIKEARSVKDPRSLQNKFNDNMIQEESNGINDHESLAEVQTQRPNMVPSDAQKSHRQGKPNMKTNVPNEDEMRIDTSSMDTTEYKRKYSNNVEDIAISIEEHISGRPGSVNPHDDESEEMQKKFKGYDISHIKKRPSEGKVPSKKKLLNNKTSNGAKPYNDHEGETGGRVLTSPYVNEGDGCQDQMQNKFEARLDPKPAKQPLEEKEYKQDMIPRNNETSEKQEPNMTLSDIEKQGNDDVASEYDKIEEITVTLEKHISLKIEGEDLNKFLRNDDNNDGKLFSGKSANKPNIIPSNKRSPISETDEENSRSNSPVATEYEDAYGSKIEDDTSMADKSRHMDKSAKIGHGDIVIINSNKESENFVLGNKDYSSPLTSEYRDAYGTKVKYVIHQCSTNLHGDQMLDNRYRSIEANLLKTWSKGKAYEPKMIHLNRKISDGQIELNMKSCDGNEIYSAYLYPDDSISKIWSLTELNYDEFVVTVEDKILHRNVPLKNYNINGDVTLNISKRKPSFIIKGLDDYESKNFSDQRDVDYSSDEDHFSDKVANEEGYSS